MAGGVKKKLPVATGGKMGIPFGEKWGKMGKNKEKWGQMEIPFFPIFLHFSHFSWKNPTGGAGGATGGPSPLHLPIPEGGSGIIQGWQ